jgi:uncharacterized protein YoxC
MESWQVAVLVLVAVLVGALLPMLVQLYSVLHTLHRVVDKVAKDAEQMTVTIHRTADRVDRITAALEKDGKVEKAMEGVAALSSMVLQLRDTVKVASAVGAAVVPAVGAAVRAWHGAHDGAGAEPGERGGGEASPAEEIRKEVAS